MLCSKVAIEFQRLGYIPIYAKITFLTSNCSKMW